jgi:transposase
VLAEIGDDRSRFANARSLKAYAGAAPVTRASGKSLTVSHRRVKNQRLGAVGYVCAFAALTASPGAQLEVGLCGAGPGVRGRACRGWLG